MIKAEDFTKPLTSLLAEAFGVLDSSDAFFLDSGQDGLLGTIDGLSAVRASTPLKADLATVASHCAHVLYLLQLFDAYEQGQFPQPDWPGSWRTRIVDEAAWKALRADLKAAYRAVTGRLNESEAWPEPRVAASMMLLAHCSYHVGQVRMLLTAIPS